jgi:uncharacterized membrane protein YbhN (UPF0104 family)
MSAPGPRANWLRVALALAQIGVSAALLTWALLRIDRDTLAQAQLHPIWLSCALLCTAPAFAAAALRWWFTAQRLGVGMPLGSALREVYAASLLNGLLPSGLSGEMLRVVRHGRRLGAGRGDYTRALAAVALERAAGQLSLWLLLLGSLSSWPAWPWTRSLLLLPPGLIALALLVRAALRKASATFLRTRSEPRAPTRGGTLLRLAHTALIADAAWCVQLGTSAVVLVACLLGFYCSAQGLGVPLTGRDTLRVVPPLLAASALPLSVGGFGLREASGAALYAAAGLDAGVGAAVAALFGVLNVIGSLPGAVTLWLSHGAAMTEPAPDLEHSERP